MGRVEDSEGMGGAAKNVNDDQEDVDSDRPIIPNGHLTICVSRCQQGTERDITNRTLASYRKLSPILTP